MSDDELKSDGGAGKPDRPQGEDRVARRAAALRANLRKRKAQSRGRRAEATGDDDVKPRN